MKMKCLRPRGLVLVLVTLPLVIYSATLETTSRYTLGDFKFPLHLSPNNTNYNRNSDSSKLNISSRIHFSYERKNGSIENAMSYRTQRKLSKISQIQNNAAKLTISNTNFHIKKNTNSKFVAASPTIVKSNLLRKNSSLTLNNSHKITIVTSKPPTKFKLISKNTFKNITTKVPIKAGTKLIKITTPRTKIKSNSTKVQVQSFSKLGTTTKKPKKKHTIHKIVTNWPNNSSGGENKQNWYEPDVPYPRPNPEISSPSPSISLGSISPLSSGFPVFPGPASSISPSLSPEITSYSPNYSIKDTVSNTPDLVDLIPIQPLQSNIESEQVSHDSSTNNNPLSVFNLDMIPDNTKASSIGAGSPCPTVHISSQVLNPLQRQECSDLSLVINSHIHQNTGTRNPVSTYDGGVEDDVFDAVEEDPFLEGVPIGDLEASDPILADPVGADGVAEAALPAGASPGGPPGGGTGGSGGSGGSGGNGSGEWRFPDLKHMFEAVGYVWNGILYLLGFFRNPYLYIIPFVLFFILSFFKVIALFPWWIPLLVLYASVKSRNSTPKDQITFTKHIHKPIKHSDGWFWNHQTKSWQNVAHFPHTKRIDGRNDIKMLTQLPQSINMGTNNNLMTWKRRKRL